MNDAPHSFSDIPGKECTRLLCVRVWLNTTHDHVESFRVKRFSSGVGVHVREMQEQIQIFKILSLP